MSWKDVKKFINYSEDGIFSKKVIGEDSVEVTLFCMAKGTEISDHTSTRNGIVYVIEGRGKFNLEGKEIEMTPGILIYMKENATHSLEAIDNTSFILYLF